MRLAHRMFLFLGIAVAAALPTVSPNTRPHAQAQDKFESKWDGKGFIAHEWGTFTTVQGSDGVVLEGLRHEERGLPSFVHDIRDTAGIAARKAKMETPVIYFYSDKERWAYAKVKFPRGLITQWYPAANEVNLCGADAKRATTGSEITELKDGFINWSVKVMAPSGDKAASENGETKTLFAAPDVAEDDPWRFCREVDANFVRQCQVPPRNAGASPAGSARGYEYEKCLFYRGLGDFTMPMTAQVFSEAYREDPLTRADGKVAGTLRTAKLALKLINSKPEEGLAHALVVYKRGDYAGFHYIGEIGRGWDSTELVISLGPVEQTTPALVRLLTEKLTKTGLYEKEALAMANTWKEGYFNDEGARVLYVLPPAFVDRELPLEISASGLDKGYTIPVVRTFVARCELLSPEREKEMMTVVERAASGDKVALAQIDKWGRFATPYLNRVLNMASDDKTRELVLARLDELKLKR